MFNQLLDEEEQPALAKSVVDFSDPGEGMAVTGSPRFASEPQRHTLGFATDAAVKGGGDGPSVSDYLKKKFYGEKLKAAEEQRTDLNANAGIGEAFQTMTAAAGGVKADPSFYRDMAKRAGQPIEDVKTEMSTAKNELDLEKQTALQDPKSRQSTVLQSTIKRLYPGQFKDEDLANVSAADMDLLYKPLQLKEQIEQRREAARLRHDMLGASKAAGKKLSAEQTNKLADHDAALAQLDDIEKAFHSNESDTGPIAGRLSTLNPYNTSAKALDALAKTAAQNMGKSLEGGKLTDQDIVRYREMLPQLTDAPAVAKAKIDQARRMVLQRRESELGSYGKAGYSVADFPQKQPTGADVLSPERSERKVVRQQFSPSRGQTRVTYSDGSQEIVDGKIAAR